MLRPVHDASGGIDGFVSLEVAPALAHDTDGTMRSARHFHELVAEPNLYVKIPATAEGVPAIRTMIAEGRSINITLIFSLERYARRDRGLHRGPRGPRGRRRRATSPRSAAWPRSS